VRTQCWSQQDAGDNANLGFIPLANPLLGVCVPFRCGPQESGEIIVLGSIAVARIARQDGTPAPVTLVAHYGIKEY
jgi:hypothetical protein